MLCSSGHNNNLVNNVLNGSTAACLWCLWQIPGPLEKTGRFKEEGWVFHLEEISSVPLSWWFQACPWTRITGVTHVTFEAIPGDLSCFIDSYGPAPCYHGYSGFCSPAIVNARKPPCRWVHSCCITASGKGCGECSGCPPLLPGLLWPLHWASFSTGAVGRKLPCGSTDILAGAGNAAVAQWRPLQRVRGAKCTSFAYVLLNLAICELYLMGSF